MSDLRDSKVYQKAYAFSICIVSLYKQVAERHKEYVLSKQILRSGTSIGAPIICSRRIMLICIKKQTKSQKCSTQS